MKNSRVLLVLTCIVVAAAASAAPSLQSYVYTTPAGSPGNPAGVLSNPDGTNNAALFYGPTGLTEDSSGNLFVTDGGSIRKITRVGTDWVVTTLAGFGVGHAILDGTNGAARFNSPSGLAVDSAGNLYVADTLNHAIRKVTPIGTNWVVTTIAGMTNIPGIADGTNFSAQFNTPYGIAIDAATNLYVADTYNNIIRKVRPVGGNWVVTTIAGLAGASGGANGSNNIARFNLPSAIALDAQTNLYVTDYQNQTIRKIALVGTNWVVTTLAGSTTNSGSADGTNSAARFFQPQALTVDASGTLYISDSGNSTIRQCSLVGTNWVVTTLGGTVGMPGSADGVGSNGLFNNPWGILLENGKNIMVLDNYEDTIRFGQLGYSLRITSVTNHVLLSWSTNAIGYQLESSSFPGTGAAWKPLTNGITVLGPTFVLDTNLNPGNVFYRLHKP